ncbi:MAG: alpha/beta fold hydrolase [Flavobacteriales bacterium]
MKKTLKTGAVTWSYLDNEKGEEVWLTFHGYGQSAEVMHRFMKTFRPEARVLSFDLPLHGETKTRKLQSLRTSDLGDLLGDALRITGGKKCSVLAFSLGGKIGLKLAELSPNKMDQLVLIAPDGLKINPFYWFATNTFVGKLIFELVIQFPQPILVTSKALASIRLMHPKIHEFVSSQLASKSNRQKILATWMMFKNVQPSLDQVRKKIWRYKIRPTLVFGKHDKVIHPKLSKKLSGENCSTAEVIMLDAGHGIITRKYAEQLQKRVK